MWRCDNLGGLGEHVTCNSAYCSACPKGRCSVHCCTCFTPPSCDRRAPRLRLRMYADDCQVYLSTSVEDVPLAVSKFAAYVVDINAWLSACRIRLNAAKTQLLWLGSSQLVDRVDYHDVPVLGTRVAISDTARDLGVVIDRELSLAAHVTAVCRSGYNQLLQLRPVVRSLSVNATKTLVQAFISCRLDYCNSLLFGISDGLLRRLQSVQNAAARLVTGARRCDHITPVLRQLHWLPVRQRVVFKIAGIGHQSLVRAAPAYLADDFRLLSDVCCRPLRSNSNDTRKLLVPRTHNKLGDTSFSAAGPRLWNDLPAAGTYLRLLETFSENSSIWRPKRLVTPLNV